MNAHILGFAWFIVTAPSRDKEITNPGFLRPICQPVLVPGVSFSL